MAKPSHKLARVALVGRVNVGKSTLFNRLVGDRKALVSPIPGTTRDRREAEVIWRGEPFTLIDTGGVEVPGQVIAGTRDDFTSRITEQTEAALAGASAVVFVTSAIDGVCRKTKVGREHWPVATLHYSSSIKQIPTRRQIELQNFSLSVLVNRIRYQPFPDEALVICLTRSTRCWQPCRAKHKQKRQQKQPQE